jgi:hypothetical protein
MGAFLTHQELEDIEISLSKATITDCLIAAGYCYLILLAGSYCF